MKKHLSTLIIILGLSITSINAQTYFPLRNVETNLGPFSNINGQWIAVTPTNNTLGSNYYQGINFGFDTNNYASLVNAIGTNEIYFGRWSFDWKDWNKIWHSGNLNNINSDFIARTITSSKINLKVTGSQETIDAFTIDIGSFGNAENAVKSSYFRVRDIGAGSAIPFIIKGNGYVRIGTTNPTAKLTVAGDINSREVRVTVDAGADFVFENNYDLPSLTSIETFIKENKRLPEIASAKEMQENGINLSEMNIKLLKKIEELTLYSIEQNKEIQKQNNKILILEEKVKKIESTKL
jgi:hypothetical protein